MKLVLEFRWSFPCDDTFLRNRSGDDGMLGPPASLKLWSRGLSTSLELVPLGALAERLAESMSFWDSF